MSLKQNSWTGWKCAAGVENIYISPDGNLYVGTCKVGGIFGNVYEDNFGTRKTWITCDKERCMCG